MNRSKKNAARVDLPSNTFDLASVAPVKSNNTRPDVSRDPKQEGERSKLYRIPKKGKTFWGESLWDTIHIFGASLRPSSIIAFKSFLNLLPDLLPCADCGVHFKGFLEKVPVDVYLRNNHDAFFWTYLAHDSVNKRHNTALKSGEKPKQSPPFEIAKRYYFTGLGQDCKICG